MAVVEGVLFAVATLLCWGAADFFAKKAVDKVGFVVALLINQVVALAPICVFALAFSSFPALSIDRVLLIIVTGVLGLLGFFYLYKGFKKGNLSVVSPISASWFVITTLIAALLFTEVITAPRILAVVIVFFGVFFASTDLTEFRHSIRQVKSNGVLEALLSMAVWGLAFALIKPIVDFAGPIMALLLTRLIATSTLLLWIKATKIKIGRPHRALLVIMVIAGLLDVTGFATYNASITTEYVSIVSPIAAAYPAVTILLAHFLLRERLKKTQKIGVAAILAGLAIITIV